MNKQTWCLEWFALKRFGVVLPDVVLLISPAYHGRNTRGGGHNPHKDDIHDRPAGGSLVSVPDWKHGGRESICRDDAQIPY